MSETQMDKRVLADLRSWIGVGAEKVSDQDLWNKTSFVRNQLIIHYATRDLGEAFIKQMKTFHETINSAILLIGKSYLKK